MTLSDLSKYSMTRSIARSLCDSWDSCSCLLVHDPTEKTVAKIFALFSSQPSQVA